MQQTNVFSGGANQMQLVLDTSQKIPLTYHQTLGSGDTEWTGSYVLPGGTATGAHNYTVEANANYIATDIVTNFATPATNSNNTGFTMAGAYTVVVAPTVTTQAATDLAVTTATGNGNITDAGGENDTVRGFEYGLTETPTWSTRDDIGGYSTGAYTKGLMGLSANTIYHIRAFATNSAGTSYGGWTTFNTLANVPAAPTVNAPTTSSLKITLTDNASTDYAILNETANKYIKADGTMDDTTPVWQTYTQWGSGSGIVNTGLSSNTSYTYKVKARNGDLVETALSSGTAQTTLDVAPAAPSGVSIGSISTSGFTINWTDNSSNETGFKVYTTAGQADCSAASYSGIPDFTTAADAVSQAITSKSVNTQYCAAVKATNAVGDSAASYASVKYTLANVPGAPTVNATSSSSLTVVVNQNSNPPGTEYAISTQLPTTPPLNGTDLAAWYSASSGVTVDGASKVQNWTPRYTSNGTGSLVATTDDGGSVEGASTPPTLVPDGLAGKPTVRFTAADLTALKNVAGVGVNFNADDYTLVLVRNMNVTPGFPQSYYTLLSAPGVQIGVHYIHYLLGDGSVDTQSFTPTPATTTWSLAVSGSSYKTYIGSTATDDGAIQRDMSALGQSPVYIGRDLLNWGWYNPFSATMDLSEILVFKKALTADEIGTVYSDLTNNSELVTKYVQADGSLGASAVWQTYDQWGGASGIANTGLSVSTEYSYQVKARNGDLIETALSASGSNTTLATDTAPATHGSKKKKETGTVPAETPVTNEALTPESIVEQITQSLHDYNVSELSASFTMSADNITGSTVTFDASGSTSDKGIVSYEWDFGDGTRAEGMKVEHEYKSPGRYTVTLTITDQAGDKNTTTQTIDIKPAAPTITNITAKSTALWIEGKSDPGTTIYFTIHSNSFEGQGLANQDGYWTYFLDNASEVIGEGDHTIVALAAVKLADNTEIRGAESKTYDFKMSVDNGKLKVEMKRTRIWQIVAGVFGLLFISLIIFLVLKRRRTQKY